MSGNPTKPDLPMPAQEGWDYSEHGQRRPKCGWAEYDRRVAALNAGGIKVRGISQNERRVNPCLKSDLEEKITDIIEKELRTVEAQGHIIPACDGHARRHIVETADGEEVCSECAADGGSGELVHLGLDSVAIEIAQKIVAALKGGGG